MNQGTAPPNRSLPPNQDGLPSRPYQDAQLHQARLPALNEASIETLRRPIQTLKAYYRLTRQIRQGIPVLVYQMGKVGSLSVVTSLRAAGVRPVFHLHRMNADHIRAVWSRYPDLRGFPLDVLGLRLNRLLLQRQRPVRIISLVREPIGRNVSAFFHNWRDAVATMGGPDDAVQALRARFLDEYPHEAPLTWFDMEMKAVVGLDVFEHPFDPARGYQVLQHGACEVLVLKLELTDVEKADVIRRFLGLHGHFTLLRENAGQRKAYAETYQRFKEAIQLPASYVDVMLNSRYTRHFYTDAEIAQVYERWSKRHTVS